MSPCLKQDQVSGEYPVSVSMNTLLQVHVNCCQTKSALSEEAETITAYICAYSVCPKGGKVRLESSKEYMHLPLGHWPGERTETA